jgi:hypothetical protein
MVTPCPGCWPEASKLEVASGHRLVTLTHDHMTMLPLQQPGLHEQLPQSLSELLEPLSSGTILLPVTWTHLH